MARVVGPPACFAASGLCALENSDDRGAFPQHLVELHESWYSCVDGSLVLIIRGYENSALT